jgi:hypothetical protein
VLPSFAPNDARNCSFFDSVHLTYFCLRKVLYLSDFSNLLFCKNGLRHRFSATRGPVLEFVFDVFLSGRPSNMARVAACSVPAMMRSVKFTIHFSVRTKAYKPMWSVFFARYHELPISFAVASKWPVDTIVCFRLKRLVNKASGLLVSEPQRQMSVY